MVTSSTLTYIHSVFQKRHRVRFGCLNSYGCLYVYVCEPLHLYFVILKRKIYSFSLYMCVYGTMHFNNNNNNNTNNIYYYYNNNNNIYYYMYIYIERV